MTGERRAEEAGRLSVLLVDDNRDVTDSLGLLMQLYGYDVCIANSGEDGLRMAREQRPDCALLDIGMPGMDGYTLARLLRSEPELRTTKLIAHTAYSSDDHIRRMDEVGFDYRLLKPATPTQLEELLRMLEQVKRLAQQTEELARTNAELATEAKELFAEAKEDLQEIKQDIKEMKEDIKEMKEEVREVKEMVDPRDPKQPDE